MKLDLQALETLFPFYLHVDADGRVIGIGSSLRAVAPGLREGTALLEQVDVLRPMVVGGDVQSLQGARLLVELKENGLHLRGQLVFADDGSGFFAASPWATRIEELRAHDIKLSQFAIHDPIADFLALVQTQDAMVANARDVAERLRQQRQELEQAKLLAEEANAVKNQILAAVSHEIRTPLNAIIGFLEMLLADGLEPAKKEFAVTAGDAATQLLSLVDDVVDLARIEAGAVSVETRPFDLAGTLEASIDAFRPLAEPKGLLLALEAPSEPLFVTGDPTRIRQVLNNLLSNAIKFTRRGSVRLIARPLETGWSIAVEDSGAGIAAEQLETIFEPFARLDDAITGTNGGTGLGLAISRRLAEQMGGSLTAHSQPGHGSTFDLRLPLQPAEGPAPKAVSPTDIGQLEGMSVLVVDDVQANRRLLELILARVHADVDLAASGREAVERCARRRYDIILMDIFMPEISGIDATVALRREGLNQQTPVLAVTADSRKELRAECLESGMDGFLTKPVRPATLLSAIAAIAGSTAA